MEKFSSCPTSVLGFAGKYDAKVFSLFVVVLAVALRVEVVTRFASTFVL